MINLGTLWTKLLAVIGCAFLILGIILLMTGKTAAQNDQPEYVGSKECASCHRNLARDHSDSNHALALQEVGRDKDIILADFDLGEDIRQVQFPGEDVSRAFTADDIAYVIGSGRFVQRYLYEVDRNEYQVFPAEWNIINQQWETFRPGDNWPSETFDWAQNCAYCHTTGFNIERGRWEDDGVQCESCHGPASIHVELADDAGRRPSDEELDALRSAIYRSSDPQVCGQCHSQGTGTDNHPYPVGYVPGKNLDDFYELVANDSGDHWWVSGHASQSNMQYNEWFISSHATSLIDLQKSKDAADQCLTCHSQDYRQRANMIAQVEEGEREGQLPDSITVSTAQWGVTCTTCHNQHTDSEEPFNLVQEANQLCINCHTNPQETSSIHHPVKEMFEGAILVQGVDAVSGVHFSAENGPRCATCHMQQISVGTSSRATHRFRPVLPGETEQVSSACSECHEDLTTTDLRLLVEEVQDRVRARLTTALARLGTIQQPDPGTEKSAQYQQAVEAINFVQNDGSLGIHNYAYADDLLQAAEENLSLLSVSGANLSPTEAPAPTVTPSSSVVREVIREETVSPSGVRPMTIIVIGIVLVSFLIAAVAFFRKSREQE